MVSWPLTTGWTVFMVLLAGVQFGSPSNTGLAWMAGALFGAFLMSWGLQSVTGWIHRKWVSLWTSGSKGNQTPATRPTERARTEGIYALWGPLGYGLQHCR